MMNQQQIGHFIQERRKGRGMTQQELAERLGVTNKAVSKWEKGRSMPDVALFEPLCRELEIGIPELLAGRSIEAEEQQKAAEELLMESISRGKLVGLQVFLMINAVVGAVLVLSPALFSVEKPLSGLLFGFGVLECVMSVYFDSALPGREARRESFTVRAAYTLVLFCSLGVLNYPSSVREGVPLVTEILTFLIPCLLSLLGQYLIWRRKRRKRSED